MLNQFSGQVVIVELFANNISAGFLDNLFNHIALFIVPQDFFFNQVMLIIVNQYLYCLALFICFVFVFPVGAAFQKAPGIVITVRYFYPGAAGIIMNDLAG